MLTDFQYEDCLERLETATETVKRNRETVTGVICLVIQGDKVEAWECGFPMRNFMATIAFAREYAKENNLD